MKWMVGASTGVSIGQTISYTTYSIPIWGSKRLNFDSNGSLFVPDMSNNQIKKFIISCRKFYGWGLILDFFNIFVLVSTDVSTTTAPAMITSLSAIVVNNSDTSCSMPRWYPNATTVAGSPIGEHDNTATTLYVPTDVFVDENDTIYVLDALSFRVQRFRPPSLIGTTVVNISYYVSEPIPSPLSISLLNIINVHISSCFRFSDRHQCRCKWKYIHSRK